MEHFKWILLKQLKNDKQYIVDVLYQYKYLQSLDTAKLTSLGSSSGIPRSNSVYQEKQIIMLSKSKTYQHQIQTALMKKIKNTDLGWCLWHLQIPLFSFVCSVQILQQGYQQYMYKKSIKHLLINCHAQYTLFPAHIESLLIAHIVSKVTGAYHT